MPDEPVQPGPWIPPEPPASDQGSVVRPPAWARPVGLNPVATPPAPPVEAPASPIWAPPPAPAHPVRRQPPKRAAELVVGVAFFLIAYALLLLAQTARAYFADLASTEDVMWTAVRAVGTCLVTWAVVGLRRWAWWFATILSGILVLLALVGLIALVAGSLLAPGVVGAEFAFLDRSTELLIAATLLCLMAAFGTLIAGLIRNVTRSPEAILHIPTRLISTVLLVVAALSGALTLKAVRDPNPVFVPVEEARQPRFGATR